MKKTVVLFLALVVVLSACGLGSDSGKVLGVEEAKIKAEDFINSNLLTPGNTAAVKEIAEEGGFFKLVLSVNGQDYDSYISKDGTKFMPQVIDIAEVEAQAQNMAEQPIEQPGNTTYTEADKAEIANFVACLAGKNFKIYGANWCGYTTQLVIDIFGGFDMVQPIYVECTEQAELCAAEGIEGYPTIKINDADYQDARTFEAIGETAGCPAPNVELNVNPEEASC